MMTAHHREDIEKQDAFRARMEAQCIQIERYRLAVLRNEGRQLSRDEAGLEWVERYAETFDDGFS